jgi:NTE family protein
MKTGLVLSGGAARGIAHLGVLKALDELGIKIGMISGSSAGAITGALYASGMKPEEIFSLFTSGKFYFWSHSPLPKPLSMKAARVERMLEKQFSDLTFEQLKIPLYIATTDIENAEVVWFSSGSLVQPLLATSSMPVMSAPIRHNGNLLMDGGILNNLPVEPLVGSCDRIIGVNVNPGGFMNEKLALELTLDRCMALLLNASIQSQVKKVDIYIQPPGLINYGIFDLRFAAEIFEEGYSYTMSMKGKLTTGLGV